MPLFLRLLSYVKPYWRRLLAALACMAVFAVLSGVSLGMILPFMNMLFQEGTLVGGAVTGEMADPGETASAVVDPGTADQVGVSESFPDGTADGAVADVPDDAERQLPADFAPIGDVKDVLRARLLALFAGPTPSSVLGKICLVLLVVFFVKAIFGYLQTFLMITVEQRVIRDIRNALFSHLTELSLSFFHGERTGQLISRITNDVSLVRRALVATFANLFRESLLAALYLALAIWISWRLALVTFIVLPPILIAIGRIGQRLRKRSARIQEKMADITSTLQETISGIRVVKAFGMEEYEQGRFFKHTWEFFRRTIRLQMLGALAGPLTEYLGVIGIVVVLWYGGRQVLLDQSVSPDWFLIFLAATLSTMQPLRKLGSANNELQIGLAAAKRIFDILDTTPSIVSAEGAPLIDEFRDRIVYEGISFRYGTGDEVLSDIDLTIARGEIVAVVGPSGAGKSTLLDLLPRFYDPIDGRITIDGQDVRDVDLASLRRLMGIVTQETILFNDTVRNNIAYGFEGARDEDIAAAAQAANAHGFIEGLSDGYDTLIGERGTMVSGGERQRIAIARAILKNPPILVFDEATSSLDTESERLVQGAIEHLLSGRTVLLIAHRLSTIRNADRIIVIDDGRIKETGTHQELMDTGGLYRHLYDMQFEDEPVGPQSSR
jgi:subfamily B ATP-binding cassette protein MsbA